LDGHRITDTERRTLLYIVNNFPISADAVQWLKAQFSVQSPEHPYEEILRRVIRQEYNLKNLSWEIDTSEAELQDGLGRPRLFESALRGALKAFLGWNQGQLSLGAFANRHTESNNYPTPEHLLRSFLDQGTLFLVPYDQSKHADFEYDLPDNLVTDRFWYFGLHIPECYPGMFLATMLRDRVDHQVSKGYISRKPKMETLASEIITRLLDFPGMTWSFDPTEIDKQLSLEDHQNFGNALFAALHGGIFNGESSMSFRDFIAQEIWPDPERETRDFMREYLNDGANISLLPINYRQNNSFDLPAFLNPWVEGEWQFVIEMPRRTHIRYLVNIPRYSDDGETGWNDGYTPVTNLSFDEQLKAVLKNEFGLPDVKLTFPESEYEAQRQQFGPFWRHPQGLLRQAINTLQNDYKEPRSVFNTVRQAHNIQESSFANRQEFKKAVSSRTLGYLKTASIEFLPIELPDNNPIDGEAIETYWQFFVMMPDFSDHGFWVIIPRWPDEDQLPYVYGVN
jgi:hypothetical protein